MIANNAAGTIPEPPKIRLMLSGSCARTAELEPSPYPTPSATETIVTFLGDIGHLVISWIPLTTMEENIMTAAPPRTLCGMIEISAASFGNSPHAIRKIPPIPML